MPLLGVFPLLPPIPCAVLVGFGFDKMPFRKPLGMAYGFLFVRIWIESIWYRQPTHTITNFPSYSTTNVVHCFVRLKTVWHIQSPIPSNHFFQFFHGFLFGLSCGNNHLIGYINHTIATIGKWLHPIYRISAFHVSPKLGIIQEVPTV
jgi:hypothetical protein